MGKIKKAIVSRSPQEWRAAIPVELYDRVIQLAAPLGLSKGDVLVYAFMLLLQTEGEILRPDTCSDAAVVYRGGLKKGMVKSIERLQRKLAFNKPETTIVALSLFVNSEWVQSNYKEFLRGVMRAWDCSVEEAIAKIREEERSLFERNKKRWEKV